MKTKKKRPKIHYSDTSLAKAFLAGTLSPGVISLGNSTRATPERLYMYDTTFTLRGVLPDGRDCIFIRNNSNEPAWGVQGMHNAMRQLVSDQQFFYWRREHHGIVHTNQGLPIIELARIVPGSTPEDWRRDWVEAIQFYYHAIVSGRKVRSSVVTFSACYWHIVNVGNNMLRYLDLPQLTREEVFAEEVEGAIAVEMFKQKADESRANPWRRPDSFPYQTPKFLAPPIAAAA
jgi:hypothetical protein